MGKTRYSQMQEFLEPIVGKKIHVNKLWRRIMIEVGSDARTIREYMNNMISLGMICEVKENVYKIIFYKVDL